jgi:hypothetical protein
LGGPYLSIEKEGRGGMLYNLPGFSKIKKINTRQDIRTGILSGI